MVWRNGSDRGDGSLGLPKGEKNREGRGSFTVTGG